MLDAEEVGRRIKAARELRGLSQDDLARLLAKDGLGRYDAGRIERGELTMSRVHRDSLTRNLGVPDRWFLSGSVDEIVGLRPSDEDLARLLGPQLLAAVQALRKAEEQGPLGTAGQDRRPEFEGAPAE